MEVGGPQSIKMFKLDYIEILRLADTPTLPTTLRPSGKHFSLNYDDDIYIYNIYIIYEYNLNNN